LLLKKNEKKYLVIAIALIALCAILFSIVYLNNRHGNQNDLSEKRKITAARKKTDNADITMENGVVKGNIIVMPAIDYKQLTNDDQLKELMASRKQDLGLSKSIDMIVNSDENFTIGGVKVSMSDILKQAFFKEGEVFEEKIENSGEIRPQKIKKYGIYVIQPGDNIWNIHFNILKEFYDHNDINVSPEADEPGTQGLSSGVGKILKFSETLVIIYNLIEKKVDTDIDLLEPLSKIVVYNMDEVFSLLTQINYNNIDRIQFDGKTIWIPAEK